MSPEEIVMTLLGAGRVIAVERIKHGLTNESWLVRTDVDALVVRMSNTAEASLQINRASEALILDAVARADIGPQVLLCDPARHLLVTRYMGPTWSDEDAARGENILRIAGLLRRLHAIEPLAGLHSVELTAVIDGYLNTLDASGASGAAADTASRKKAHEAATELRRGSATCLCHNDIHALNIVDSDGTKRTLRLIDWEYSGLGEPLFDLASLCVYHSYDQAQREQLLRAYAGSSERTSMHRLQLACWLFEYVRELWMEVRAGAE